MWRQALALADSVPLESEEIGARHLCQEGMITMSQVHGFAVCENKSLGTEFARPASEVHAPRRCAEHQADEGEDCQGLAEHEWCDCSIVVRTLPESLRFLGMPERPGYNDPSS